MRYLILSLLASFGLVAYSFAQTGAEGNIVEEKPTDVTVGPEVDRQLPPPPPEGTADRGQMSGDRQQGPGNRPEFRPMSGDRQLPPPPRGMSGDRQQMSGDRQQGPGNRPEFRPMSGDKQLPPPRGMSGDRQQLSGDRQGPGNRPEFRPMSGDKQLPPPPRGMSGDRQQGPVGSGEAAGERGLGLSGDNRQGGERPQNGPQVSEKIKTAVDKVIASFQAKLDASGLTNEQIVEKIEKVQQGVDAIIQAKPQSAKIYKYLHYKLHMLKEKYQDEAGVDESDLESLLDIE